MTRPRRLALLAVPGLAASVLAVPAQAAEPQDFGFVPAAASVDVPAPTTQDAPARARLVAGDVLGSGESLSSPDGTYELVAQPDGDVVLRVRSSLRVLWRTATSAPGARLTVQTDGNVVVYDAEGRAVWASATAGRRGTTLSVRDDGRLVLRWRGGARTLVGPNDRLAPGERLVPGRALTSTDGRYRLTLQDDGNLVQTDVRTGGPLWATGTSGRTSVVLQGDGNLVVHDAGGTPVWASATGGAHGAWLTVGTDGLLSVVHQDKIAWQSSRGHAAGGALGDDYPRWLAEAGKDALVDPWRFYNRECTSFVAWRLTSANDAPFDNFAGQAIGQRWGNAATWGPAAQRAGYRVDDVPAVGSVAWWDTGRLGHVAWVAQVNDDGTVLIEEYNIGGTGFYGTRTIPASDVTGFIHVKDL